MKKLLTILLIAFSISSYAQTKEETINWIKEKSTLYGTQIRKESEYTTDSYVSKIIGDTLIFEHSYQFKGYYYGKVYLYKVSLNDIIAFEKGVIIQTNGLKISVFVTKINKKGIREEVGYKEENCSKMDFVEFVDFNAEQNLKERFIRALTKLAEYNAANLPKEAF